MHIEQNYNDLTTERTAIITRLDAIRDRIHRAEVAAARPVGSVQLLAVSKTHATSKIRIAWQGGQRLFGENYLQEALSKGTELKDLDIEWHFIGRVQSNKTREIATNFAWVHSLSDLGHARRLNVQRPSELPPLNVCIQVNLSNEPNKGGVAPTAVLPLAIHCAHLSRLRLRGLMTIPEPVTDPMLQRNQFSQLRLLLEGLQQKNLLLDTLSMGMSDDLEAAVAEGATIVRIGTAIFGPRDYNAN